LRLVALGFVIAYQLEIHSSLYGRDEGGLRLHFCVNMPFR
jgi:hypothetical protein